MIITLECPRCARPVNHKHGDLCAACIEDDMDDWDDEPDEDPALECAGFTDMLGEFYCPMWGSEECDWECPYGGMR